jgi:hypothetical protein
LKPKFLNGPVKPSVRLRKPRWENVIVYDEQASPDVITPLGRLKYRITCGTGYGVPFI